MLTNYQKGAEKERRIVRKLRNDGWIAVRSAGSHSIVDVWAVNPGLKKIKLIQSKLHGVSKPEFIRILDEGQKLNGVYDVSFEIWE